MLSETAKWIVVFAITILLHEVFHAVAYWIYGYKPKIKITWWGLTVGEDMFFWLTPRQAYVVLWYGAFGGFVYFMLYKPSNLLTTIYLLMCSIDIVNLLAIFKYRRLSDRPLIDIQIEELIKWKTENPNPKEAKTE